jgi:hypothetical protein
MLTGRPAGADIARQLFEVNGRKNQAYGKSRAALPRENRCSAGDMRRLELTRLFQSRLYMRRSAHEVHYEPHLRRARIITCW